MRYLLWCAILRAVANTLKSCSDRSQWIVQTKLLPLQCIENRHTHVHQLLNLSLCRRSSLSRCSHIGRGHSGVLYNGTAGFFLNKMSGTLAVQPLILQQDVQVPDCSVLVHGILQFDPSSTHHCSRRSSLSEMGEERERVLSITAPQQVSSLVFYLK